MVTKDSSVLSPEPGPCLNLTASMWMAAQSSIKQRSESIISTLQAFKADLYFCVGPTPLCVSFNLYFCVVVRVDVPYTCTPLVCCPRACCWSNPQYHGKSRRSSGSLKHYRFKVLYYSSHTQSYRVQSVVKCKYRIYIKLLFKTTKRRPQRNGRWRHSFNLHKDLYHGRSALFVTVVDN